jgi:diguanylate cyclase (GGDEF)-like protein/PAS domain S-box-containing protein
MTTPPPRLLLVDDEDDNRDMLGRRLLRHGYDVVAVAGGREALARLDEGGLDLVLLDIQMPEMSGLDVLRAARLRFPPQALPIIMVTAKCQSEDVVEALELGASDYITKPVELPVALARIKSQLARCAAERALSESEQRYALAVRGANDGVWDWKPGEHRLYLSPRWKAMLGYEDGDLPDDLSSWLDRVHPDDLPRLRDDLDEHLAGRTAQFESEHRLRHRSGMHRWVLTRGVAVRDAEGRAVRMAGSLTDITDAKVADPLTGLPNRVLFVDRLGRALALARRRPERPCAVLFLDLDRFKNVNDSLGHLAGDHLLVQVAQRLQAHLWAADTLGRFAEDHDAATGHTVARLGGDEFALLLTGLHGAADAVLVARRLLDAFRDPFRVAGMEIGTSASIGVAVSGPDDPCPEALLRDADTAMYHAKGAGRGQVALFDEAMRERARRRLRLETDLLRGIEAEELVIHYQPIVDLAAGRVSGLEALIRWSHPELGLVAPGEFIPIAEDSGAIVAIGYWVADRVCRQLREWIDAGLAGVAFSMGVNLSVRQLAQPDLVERMCGIAAAHGIGPHWIEFEITESCLMTRPEEAAETLARLKAAGFRLSIDDFGTGYSSLTYVHRLPVDRLKIDRSFLERQDGCDYATVVSSIVALAERLKIEVVAEGVETREQSDLVRSLRCGFGQGYYFARPQGVPEAERFLPPVPVDESQHVA